MGATVTNNNGGDVSFYVDGQPVVIVNGGSIDIDDDNASALMSHPVFAAMVEAGKLSIGTAAEAPAPKKKAKAAEAPAPQPTPDPIVTDTPTVDA